MSKKRETLWRDKLVSLFWERNQRGFIWVNGSLFKQGFPDLTMIQEGVTTYVELKVEPKVRKDPMQGLSQRQRLVLDQIGKAGGRSYCATLDLENREVHLMDFRRNLLRQHPQKEFEFSLWGWAEAF